MDPELRNDLSALFLVRVRPPVVEEVEVIPVVIDDMQVNLAQGTERDFFLDRLVKLCAEMGTAVARGAQSACIIVGAEFPPGGGPEAMAPRRSNSSTAGHIDRQRRAGDS